MFYESHVYPDPGYPVICHSIRMQGDRNFVNAHWHENYELLHVMEGELEGLLDGRKFHARAGETVVINSGVMHYLHAATPVCSYECLIANADLLYQRGMQPDKPVFQEVLADAETADRLHRIVQEHFQRPCLFQMNVLAQIDGLFVHLMRNFRQEHMEEGMAPVAGSHEAVKHAMRYIHAHYAEPLTLDDICRQVGFAKNYFCRVFAEYAGLPPIRYLNHVRCEDARRMLRAEGCTVAEAAQRCGFPNVSHFSQYYRKVNGHSPSVDSKNGSGK
ncbi:MAG: AraC family transcriptional regulator [Clostridiales bacterium]|nr:AraC family transcriptional regulator [Clostridiales bacterium]